MSMSMLSPPPLLLAPALWNLSVVFVLAILLGWALRVVRRLQAAHGLRRAMATGTVVRLLTLGSSLSALRGVSDTHLRQLMRRRHAPIAVRMPRMRVPFSIAAASLRATLSPPPSPSSSASVSLMGALHCRVPCSVQVFWHVAASALTLPRTDATPPSSASSPSSSSRDGLRNRSRWWKRRQQSRRDDDGDVSKAVLSDAEPEAQIPVGAAASASGAFRGLGPTDYGACSSIQRYPAAHEPHTFTAVMQSPPGGDADTNEDDSSRDSDGHRFYAVIVIRAAPVTEPVVSSSSTTVTAKPRRSTSLLARLGSVNAARHAPRPDGAMAIECQCVAIELVPTPSQSEPASAVVVRTVNYSASDGFVSQDIFDGNGGGGGEGGGDGGAAAGDGHADCAICLEARVPCVVLLPCRHRCVCRVCLHEIERCPICRAAFSTYVSYEGGSSDSTTLGNDTDDRRAV